MIKVDYESEICCDECGDVAHNHFSCPVCGMADAPTDVYCGFWEYGSDTFRCENCGQQYKFDYKSAELYVEAVP